MALIVRRGRVPATPHTEFRFDSRFTLEEIHGSFGFSGPYSRKVHLRRYPTVQARPPRLGDFNLTPSVPRAKLALQPYHIRSSRIPFFSDAIRGRVPLLHGPSTVMSIAKPKSSTPKDAFFRNGEKHELYYIQEGRGTLRTEYGSLPLRKGLYVVIPKGTTYQVFLETRTAFLLIIESSSLIEFPPHYLNHAGQAKLTAPIVETEIELPKLDSPIDRLGRFAIDVKHDGGRITRLTLGHHPFDLVGWEGSLYPFGFHIDSHHGIAREIHTAPPMHQTFQAGAPPSSGFSICSFVPQMEGWHPKEIPAPYAHYNVDSDECMFFSNVRYGARTGVIEEGSITFHPGALPHSPHGRAAELSTALRGRKSQRLAVMLDTFFENLSITQAGYRFRDPRYPLSWHAAQVE